MSVQDKLLIVQSKLKAPKNQYNSFSNFYYRTVEDIMEAVKPLLKEVNAVLTVTDELIQIGDRYYVKATARFLDCETNEAVYGQAFAREPESKKGMDEPQITGTVSTYARKYALNGLFCLDDVKDIDSMDNTAAKAKTTKKADPAKAAEPAKLETKYVKSLESELARTGVGLKSMLQTYGVSSIADMTFDQYKDAMGVLEKKKNKPAPVMPEPEYMDYGDSSLPWNQ